MPRIVRIAVARIGPNQRADARDAIPVRMITLLEDAAEQGATLVVFPELAFTTFFPHWLLGGARFQQLEKRYFAYGDLSFRAGSAGHGAGVRGLQLRRLRPNGGTTEGAALRTFHSAWWFKPTPMPT